MNSRNRFKKKKIKPLTGTMRPEDLPVTHDPSQEPESQEAKKGNWRKVRQKNNKFLGSLRPDDLPSSTQGKSEKEKRRGHTVVDTDKTVIGGVPGQMVERVGKSTWQLDIPQRLLDGQISGVVNNAEDGNSDEESGLAAAIRKGKTARSYRIEDDGNVFAKGGQGLLYRGTQSCLNRQLLLKSLKEPEDRKGMATLQDRFVSEAVITANLVHPNIVPVHELGVDHKGRLFYSMKHVHGEPWFDTPNDDEDDEPVIDTPNDDEDYEPLIDRNSLEENLDILHKVCDAVAYAHSKGVINRDLKPENVMVGDFGEVIVLDWGLAITTRHFEKNESIATEKDGRGGTLQYSAPEQWHGDITKIVPRTDTYLLGATLFQILTGSPPHYLFEIHDACERGEEITSWLLDAALENRIETRLKVRYPNAGELMRIALKAMSTRMQDRYGTVEEFQEAIGQYRLCGRAEGILQQAIDTNSDRYNDYQRAIALFDEAYTTLSHRIKNLEEAHPDPEIEVIHHRHVMLKSLKRAEEGGRQARLAFTKLADQKQDFDLGLQVQESVPEPFKPSSVFDFEDDGATDPGNEKVAEIAPEDLEIAKLQGQMKRKHFLRTFLTRSWLVVSGLAVAILIYGVSVSGANNSLVEQKRKLEAEKGTLEVEVKTKQGELATVQADSNEKIEKAEQAAEEATELATEKIKKAENEAKLATEKIKKAEKEAKLAKVKIEKAEKDQEAAEEATELAKVKIEKAEKDKKAAETATNAARMKQLELDESLKKNSNDLIAGYNSILDAYEAVGNTSEFIKTLKKIHANDLILEEGAKKVWAEKLKNLEEKQSQSLMLSPGKLRVASFSANGVYCVAQVIEKQETKFRVFQFLKQQTDEISLAMGVPSQLCIANDGQTIAAVIGNDLQLWTRSDSDVEFSLNVERNKIPTGGHIALTPSGKNLYVVEAQVGSDRKTSVWRASLGEGNVIWSWQGRSVLCRYPKMRFKDLAVSPDGQSLVFLGEISIGQDLYSLSLSAKAEQKLELSPGLVASSEGLPVGFQLSSFSFSANGRHLLAIDGDSGTFGRFERDLEQNTALSAIMKSVRSGVLPRQNPQLVTVANDGRRIGAIWNARGIKRLVQLWDFETSGNGPNTLTALMTPHQLPLSGTQQMFFSEHSQPIEGFAFVNGDRDRFATVSKDETARLWNLNEYEANQDELANLKREFRTMLDKSESNHQAWINPTPLNRFQSDRNSSTTQSVTAPRVYLTKQPPKQLLDKGSTRREIDEDDKWKTLYSADISRDGQRVLVGADDFAAHVIRSSDGRRTMSMSGRKDAFFDDAGSGSLREGHMATLASLKYLPKLGYLLSSDNFGSISVWDAKSDKDGIGDEEAKLLTGYPRSEFSVSDDGSLILAAGASLQRTEGDRNLDFRGVIWKTDQLVGSLSPEPSMLLQNQHEAAITALDISPQTMRCVTADRRGRIVIWNIANGTVVSSISGQHSSDEITGIFFQDESTLVSAGIDGQVIRWMLKDGGLVQSGILRSSEDDAVIRLRAAPSRKQFVASVYAVASDQDSTNVGKLSIFHWKSYSSEATVIPTGVYTFDAKGSPSLAFEHDVTWDSEAKTLIVAIKGLLSLFDVDATGGLQKKTRYRIMEGAETRTGSLRLATVPSESGPQLATFLPDSDRVIALWNLRDGSLSTEFRSHASRTVASFSSDRQYALTGSETLRVFDIGESGNKYGRTVFRVPKSHSHNSPIATATFSPVMNDYRFASIDVLGAVKLWNWQPQNGVPKPLPLSTAVKFSTSVLGLEKMKPINRVAWSTDGKNLAAIQNGRLRIWNLDQVPTESAVETKLQPGSEILLNDIRFSKSGKEIAACGVIYVPEDDEITEFVGIWSLVGSDWKLRFQGGRNSVDIGEPLIGITCVAYSNAPNKLITGNADGALRTWLVTGRDSADEEGLIGDTGTAELGGAGSMASHKGPVVSLDVAETGEWVSADSDGVGYIWPALKN